MKDEMDEISAVILRLYENVNDGDQWNKTIQELQRLMCYREVRAYYSCFNNFCEEDEWADIEEDILGTLDVDYPESMILEAIEKVKNEHK